MGETTLHLRVSGRVQGVGYRAWAQLTANKLGLIGWVRNMSDGTVEALAHGDSESVDQFVVLCRRGPQFARVDTVKAKAVDAADKLPPVPLAGFQLIDMA